MQTSNVIVISKMLNVKGVCKQTLSTCMIVCGIQIKTEMWELDFGMFLFCVFCLLLNNLTQKSY